MPNPTQYWSYDAAGNRNDSVCDNLNRAASIGGVACTNDILGNRLTKGSTSYTWDDLNRMLGLTNSSFQTSYVYRADGMRASKTGFDGEETRFTRYRYDGQMGIEDFETRDNNQVNGVRSVLTQHGLGARGIDFIRTTTVTGSGVNQQTQAVDSYPVYDAHGNMVATLSKSGTNDYALSNQRSFDAWGNVRIGATAGNPTGRYCANIGHRQDDESGLIYMRARYYEPTSGRFVSEDNCHDGWNWFVYGYDSPTNGNDFDGKAWAKFPQNDPAARTIFDISVIMIYASAAVMVFAGATRNLALFIDACVIGSTFGAIALGMADVNKFVGTLLGTPTIITMFIAAYGSMKKAASDGRTAAIAWLMMAQFVVVVAALALIDE